MTSGVTAIMPSWNQGQWIGRSLWSLAGDPAISEILLMDRFSTDNTLAIAKDYLGSGGFICLRQANRSTLEAIWDGIEIAPNEWLVVATTSDWFEPHAVSTLLDYALRDPRCAYVGAGTIVHELDGSRRLKLPAPGYVTIDDIIGGGQNSGVCLFRKSLALEVGPMTLHEDGLWYSSYLLHALTHGFTARRLARPLINLRRHNGSISGNAAHAETVHAENAQARVRLAKQYAGVLTEAQCERLARPADGYERLIPRARRGLARWYYAPSWWR